MIDWTKPIETVDGRKARVVETHLENLWHIVYVYPDPDSCSSKHDVFLVNFEGYRCGDCALFSARQEPFIRNVRVKRKAWISLEMRDFYKADTKEELEARIADRNHFKPVYVEWEE